MADELEDPAEDEEGDAELPVGEVDEEQRKEQEGQGDGGDADGMAEAVGGVLVAGRVLGNPRIPTAISQYHNDWMLSLFAVLAVGDPKK